MAKDVVFCCFFLFFSSLRYCFISFLPLHEAHTYSAHNQTPYTRTRSNIGTRSLVICPVFDYEKIFRSKNKWYIKKCLIPWIPFNVKNNKEEEDGHWKCANKNICVLFFFLCLMFVPSFFSLCSFFFLLLCFALNFVFVLNYLVWSSICSNGSNGTLFSRFIYSCAHHTFSKFCTYNKMHTSYVSIVHPSIHTLHILQHTYRFNVSSYSILQWNYSAVYTYVSIYSVVHNPLAMPNHLSRILYMYINLNLCMRIMIVPHIIVWLLQARMHREKQCIMLVNACASKDGTIWIDFLHVPVRRVVVRRIIRERGGQQREHEEGERKQWLRNESKRVQQSSYKMYGVRLRLLGLFGRDCLVLFHRHSCARQCALIIFFPLFFQISLMQPFKNRIIRSKDVAEEEKTICNNWNFRVFGNMRATTQRQNWFSKKKKKTYLCLGPPLWHISTSYAHIRLLYRPFVYYTMWLLTIAEAEP